TKALKPIKDTRVQIKGMSKDYDNLTKFLDLSNYAGNNFAITTGDVGAALQRSASMLSSAGVSMEDSVALIIGGNESVQNAKLLAC
ncbi:phage tail tape measure protein, partial [Clostridioides difficile]|nr:phage tail tape measure protein [Clostridioides difficile]